MKRVSNRLFVGLVVAGLAMTWLASPVLALPPDPDNAALLYYQAFLTIADLDKEGRDQIPDVATGKVPPNEKTREYIDKCRGAMGFVEAAMEVPHCSWGFRYSQGFDAWMPQLAQMRFLTFLVVADARFHALDGDYKGAFQRCLATGTLARHVGDDTLISYLVAVAVRSVGHKCLQEIMGQAVGDAEVLQWLQNQLVTAPGESLSPVRPLKVEVEIVTDLLRMENRDKIAKALGVPEDKKTALLVASVNAETLARARQMYSQSSLSAQTVLSMALPYEQAHQQLTRLEKGLDPNDPATAVAAGFLPAVVKILSAKTRAEAKVAAVRGAVAICLQRARTGKLPETLPAGVPKDPFSGRDFQYERTDKGFVLRCQGKDLDNNVVQEFAFPVK
jgi:hypothetical protein